MSLKNEAVSGVPQGEEHATSDTEGNNTVGNKSQQDMLVLLFGQHYASLVRLASFLLDDISVCEEIVQDVFVKVQVRMKDAKFHPEPGKEASYLRSMVLNGARSRMRRRQVQKRVMSLERPTYVVPLEAEVLEVTERQRIIKLLRKLPRRQAEVLTLRFYMELSEEEIAKTLNISKGSVKTHSSRGLDKMGELLSTPSQKSQKMNGSDNG